MKAPIIPGLNINGIVDMRAAEFSGCGKFRYTLTRRWALGGSSIAFLCLNPSTADAVEDDPTVRRCIRFAKDWGFAEMVMLNLFAFRATKPAVLYDRFEKNLPIIGAKNNDYIFETVDRCDRVICGWGVHGDLAQRSAEIGRLLKHRELHCLGLTKAGFPGHPLYIRADRKPEVFRG